MTAPAAIRAELGAYPKVYIVDGLYHRMIGNINEPDRNGRSRVVGTQMRCGINKRHGLNWATESTPVDAAHAQVPPCGRCFQAALS